MTQPTKTAADVGAIILGTCMKAFDDGLATIKTTSIAELPKYLTHDDNTVRNVALQRYHELTIKQTDDLVLIKDYFTYSDFFIRIAAKKRFEELTQGKPVGVSLNGKL